MSEGTQHTAGSKSTANEAAAASTPETQSSPTSQTLPPISAYQQAYAVMPPAPNVKARQAKAQREAQEMQAQAAKQAGAAQQAESAAKQEAPATRASSAPSTPAPSAAQTHAQPAQQRASVQTTPPIVRPAAPYGVAGGVNPAGPAAQQAQQPRPPKKRRNGLLIVGIVVCIMAVALLIFALFFVLTADGKTRDIEAEPPTQSSVESAYETADIAIPNLSHYAFISTKDMEGPEISGIVVGDVTKTETDGSQTITCTTNAMATFENDSVHVEEPISMRFTYDAAENTWAAGRPQGSSPSVEPTGPADVEAVQEKLPDMLETYNADLAKQFEDCETAATANLSETGGEITFALLKKDPNSDASIQVDVNVGLAWDDGKGWKATINWVGDIVGELPAAAEETPAPAETPEAQPQPATPEPATPGTNTNPGDGASMLLVCSTGDLVEIPGTIEYRNDRVLLRADNTIRIVLDGTTYITRYFELTVTYSSLSVVNGSHVAALGEISATGTLTDVPLVINLDY